MTIFVGYNGYEFRDYPTPFTNEVGHLHIVEFFDDVE